MFFHQSFLSIIFLFLALKAEAAVPTRSSAYVLFDLSSSRTDQILAKEFYSLSTELRRLHVRTRTIKNIEKRIKNSFAFNGFEDMLERISILRSNKKLLSNFSKACPNSRAASISSTHEYFHTLVDSLCRNSFARLVKSGKIQIGANERHYIASQIESFLTNESSALTDVISVVEKESFFFKDLSRQISDVYINTKIQPDEKVLSKIIISNELTNYFQKNGSFDKRASSYFIKEFKRLSNLSERQIINGSIPESKNTLYHALGFYVENKKYIPEATAWKHLVLIADEYRENEHKSLALETFDKVLSVTGNYYTDKTIFKLITTCLNFNDAKCVQRTIKKHSLLENLADYSPKVRFWIGRSMEFVGQKSKAQEIYREVSKESPLNFYSILAVKQAGILDGKVIEDAVPIKITTSALLKEIPRKELSKPLQKSIARTSLWLDNELESFVVRESQDILAMVPEQAFEDEAIKKSFGDIEFKRFLIHQLVKLYNHKKQFLLTFKLVYRSIQDDTYSITDKSLRYLFPMEYIAKVKKIDSSIDPLLILSLIRQESAFNPRARSHVGAQGLMQLMPQTARMFKKRVKAHHLKTPKVNLNIGIRYFKRLLKKYDGNLIYTLAAYNAGEGRVKRWKKEVFKNPDPLLTIENIPFQETRNYVKYIYRNLYLYRIISDSYKLEQNIADTFVVKYR